MQLTYLGTAPVGEEPECAICVNSQRLHRSGMEGSIEIYRCQKRNTDLANQLHDLGQPA
jgi:hypothetical protein